MSNPNKQSSDISSASNGMEKIVALCKRRGFVYPSFDIYGGLAGFYDYGPLGLALKKNIENLWWKQFVTDREDVFGVDTVEVTKKEVLEASGHVGGFADPMVECQNKNCKNRRHRVDHLLDAEIYNKVLKRLKTPEIVNSFVSETAKAISQLMPADMKESFSGEGDFLTRKGVDKKIEEFEKRKGVIMQASLRENKVKCPGCGQIDWGIPKQFNMMLRTHVGATEDETSTAYLRPETAQGIFTNFKNVVDSFHPKLSFGIAQIGKAFRNEIAPRDFLFRVRELEQMEVEYFVKEGEWQPAFEMWRNEIHSFISAIGIDAKKVSELEVAEADRAHYSKRTIDFEFEFPFGKKELYGLAYRTNYDLTNHAKESGVDVSFLDEETKEKIVPHVIEPSLGVGRSLLAVLLSAYTEDVMGDEPRVYLKLKPAVAPVKVAVFPLLKNKPPLVEKAREVFASLKKEFGAVVFDDNGNIGKRYRRQDEIGTVAAVTVDFETLDNDTVTLRDRDTGKQIRVKISQLIETISEIIKGKLFSEFPAEIR